MFKSDINLYIYAIKIDGLFDFSDLSPSTQNPLRRVYSYLSSVIAVAILCFILSQYFPSFSLLNQPSE